MDIMAYGNGWAFTMGLGGFKYASNKDGSLSLAVDPKAKYKRDVVTVEAPSGVFLETLNDAGEIIGTGGDGEWYSVRLGKTPVKIRRKVLSDPELTAAQLNKARAPTTVTVVDQERYDKGIIDFGASYENGSLLRVIASFNKALRKIPEKYRAKARCELDSESGYEGSHYAHVEITYERPETDDEVIERVKIERERASLASKKRHEKFVSLKEEFEP